MRFKCKEIYESVRVRAVGMMFGVCGETVGPRPVEMPALPGEGIVLVTGASGSGKTTLLRGIEERLRGDGPSGDWRSSGGVMRLERIRVPGRAVVDCFRMPLEETLGYLGRAGLGEARVWCRAARDLSEGEKFRFRLAVWMAGRARVLVADEFCNGLDRVTARGVAWQLRRFVGGAGEGLRAKCGRGRGGMRPSAHTIPGGARLAIVATAHEDLVLDLRPEVHVRL